MSRVKNEDEFELRRESVLDTAAEAFAADSYPSVSMNQLAAACGGSKSRLYHYYEGKEACLLYTSPSPRDGLLSRMPSSA